MTYAHIPQKQDLNLPVQASSGETPLFGAYVENTWIPEHKGLSFTTLGWCGKYLRKYILPVLSSVPIGGITHEQVQDLVSSYPTWKVAKHARDTLSTVLSYACRVNHLIPYNPASGLLVYPPKVDGTERRGETLQDFTEIKQFLEDVKKCNPS